jgi:hypothetical protein
MLMRGRFILGTLAAALAVLGLGCGGGKLVTVEGKVTLDGKPLEGATVLFTPQGNQGRPAQGVTADDGSFRLSTSSEEGAERGEYKVLVTKTTGMLMPGQTAPSASDLDQQGTRQREEFAKHGFASLRSLLPAVYADPEKTPLRCRVPPDGKVVLELSSTAHP